MEFQKIMHEWKRMCAATSFCEVCPLKDEKCWATSPANMVGDSKSIEAIIMAWAEEHPEPVYPTVYEWLVSVGLLNNDMWSVSDLQKPITAEFAQKLGIHPVPIVHGDCGATNAEEARKKLGIEPKEGNRGA